MSNSALSSGALSAGSTTVLQTGRCFLNSINVVTDGTNTATVTVYDNTAPSGKVIAKIVVVGSTLSYLTSYTFGLRCDDGLTVTVAGTGSTAYIGYGAV